jgi:4-hydroxybenzoate polyprenyltransferase
VGGRFSATLELIRFDRPVGWVLLFLPAGWAILAAQPGNPSWFWLSIFLAGSFLTRSAGCVINDLFDRELDRKVERTRHRPLADRRLTVIWATGVFILLTALSASLLSFFSGKAILVAVIGYGSAVIYPLMKRFFPFPQLFMGIPFGATAPLMAWVQITGEISFQGVEIAAAGLFWSTAYDLIYAVADLPDDRKAGIRSGALTFGKNLWIVFLGFSILATLCLWVAGSSLPQPGWLLLSLLLFLGVAGAQAVRIRRGMEGAEPLRLFRSHVALGGLVLAGFWLSAPVLV